MQLCGGEAYRNPSECRTGPNRKYKHFPGVLVRQKLNLYPPCSSAMGRRTLRRARAEESLKAYVKHARFRAVLRRKARARQHASRAPGPTMRRRPHLSPFLACLLSLLSPHAATTLLLQTTATSTHWITGPMSLALAGGRGREPQCRRSQTNRRLGLQESRWIQTSRI